MSEERLEHTLKQDLQIRMIPHYLPIIDIDRPEVPLWYRSEIHQMWLLL